MIKILYVILLLVCLRAAYGQAVINNKPNNDNGEPSIVVDASMSPYTIPPSVRFIRCNAVSNPVILNFPATIGGVRHIEVKKVDNTANACTPTGAGADLIDGAATRPMTVQWQALDFKDGLVGRWDLDPRPACSDMADSIACNGTQFSAMCTGQVGTGAATIYWLFPGGTTAITCLGNAGTVGNPIAVTCTAKNLRVIAAIGSAAATGSAVTLFSGTTGGTSTGLTCALNTGATTCNDTTHTYLMTAGTVTGLWSIGVTTGQATDTITSVRASFQCQ